ncbi:MAG: tRNA uridine-5-carboxymethylaminomethyl(34) synthesis GTPase MnmE, partial [Acidiferrobacterales bacterium]
MADDESIVAVATAPGRGGIAIVRISGPAVTSIAEKLLGKVPLPRFADLLSFRDINGQAIDQGLALFFPAPHSFTGEDVLELHGHGGPVITDLLVKTIVELGARHARPGEFSERAYLNNKMDLAQAEAVADLIDAGSEAAARSAYRSLQGVFSEKVHQLVEALVKLRMFVEAAIDFPEEEVDFLADDNISQQAEAITTDLKKLLKQAQQGQLLHDGMTLALVGPPNVGKSSLLNTLTGNESAIVSEIPGTTRDVIRENINIDGLPVHIMDTAGLRITANTIEREGILRAKDAMLQADRILVIMDDRSTGDERKKEIKQALLHLPDHKNVKKGKYALLWNKIDLTGKAPASEHKQGHEEIYLSAKTGQGIDLLKTYLKQAMHFQEVGEGTFMARRRHITALEQALNHVTEGIDQLNKSKAGELLAEELRLAQIALSQIT